MDALYDTCKALEQGKLVLGVLLSQVDIFLDLLDLVTILIKRHDADPSSVVDGQLNVDPLAKGHSHALAETLLIVRLSVDVYSDRVGRVEPNCKRLLDVKQVVRFAADQRVTRVGLLSKVFEPDRHSVGEVAFIGLELWDF